MENYKYPSDLEKNGNIIMITAFKYDSLGSDALNAIDTTKTPIFSVSLPIPTSGLQFDDNHAWEETSGVEGITADSNIMADAGNTVARGAVDALTKVGGQISNIAKFKTQTAVNDFTSLMYKNPEFRNFSWQWDLVASNQSESNSIDKLIKELRKASYWSNGKINDPTGFMEVPYLFKIDGYYKNKPRFAIKAAVITAINVNEKGNDNYFITFYDAKPINISLTLSFKEVFRNTRESIDQLFLG